MRLLLPAEPSDTAAQHHRPFTAALYIILPLSGPLQGLTPPLRDTRDLHQYIYIITHRRLSPHSSRDHPSPTRRRLADPPPRASRPSQPQALQLFVRHSAIELAPAKQPQTRPSPSADFNALGLAACPSDSSFFRLRQPHSGDQIPRN